MCLSIKPLISFRSNLSAKVTKNKFKEKNNEKNLLDSCTKTAFSYNNVIYQQCDGQSMESSFAPVLATIVLTEFEKVVARPLMKSGILNFIVDMSMIPWY